MVRPEILSDEGRSGVGQAPGGQDREDDQTNSEGVTGDRGGALVTIRSCAVYWSKTAVRMEDAIENLHILGIGFGEGVQRKYRAVAGKPRGYVNQGEFTPPPYQVAIKAGVVHAIEPSAGTLKP